jgi:predicted RNA-binding protein with PUA-like domain
MAKQYWMVKQEPDTYSWSNLVDDGTTDWTGVRNFQARNNLRAMKKGDPVLFYHSGKQKAVVGLAEVTKGPYADPTATDGDWVAVDIKAVGALTQPVELSAMRADPDLNNVPLLRQSQLSVMPLQKSEYDRIVQLGKLKKF